LLNVYLYSKLPIEHVLVLVIKRIYGPVDILAFYVCVLDSDVDDERPLSPRGFGGP
jgi:hypothetical protein